MLQRILIALGVLGTASAQAGVIISPPCTFAEGADQPYDRIDLDGLVFPYSARGMNDARQVVGGMGPNTIFVWDDGVVFTHDFPGFTATATAINENGIVAGSIREFLTDFPQAFTWDPVTDEVTIIETKIDVEIWAINNDLVMAGIGNEGRVGVAIDASSGELSEIAFGDLPKQGVGTPGARGINEAGAIVGSEVIFFPDIIAPGADAWLERPYMWTAEGGLNPLSLVPGSIWGAGAVDINNNNDIVGTVKDAIFADNIGLWIDGGREFQMLGKPPNYFVAFATAINDHNQITLWAPNDLFGYTRGFIWEDGEFTDLSCVLPTSISEFVLRTAGINNNGDILVQTGPELAGVFGWSILTPAGSGNPADLDGDGVVGPIDLAQLLGAWGPCNRPGDCDEDIDGDGVVGPSDLALMLGAWGSF